MSQGLHPAVRYRMDPIWLKSYPSDVPATIDEHAYPSLAALCDAACQEFADRPAFGNYGSQMSFAELDRQARAFAGYLQAHCGIVRGDRVALMMPNILAYPVALLGVLRAGGVVVNTNPQYTPRELKAQLSDAGARAIVIFEQSLATLRATGTALEHVIVAHLGDCMPRAKGFLFNRAARRRAHTATVDMAEAIPFMRALESGAQAGFAAPAIADSDLAFLQYTGGTTGRSKGAMLSHGNVTANILQVVAWFGGRAERGREIIITALPLYHIYALTGNCFAFMALGGMNYLITDPRDLRSFIKELKRIPFTTISGVNTLFNALLSHPDFTSVDFSHLKFTSGGGMAVQRDVAERWQAVTGCVLAEGYGLTEASPVVAINRFDVSTFTGCIGLPVPSTECKIVDDSGAELAAGIAGELCVRGPQVMQGYWNSPEESANVLRDGWLHTGDIALIQEDGYLRIVDRKKDMILVSGFNVYPNEIEDVAVAHPGVHEAAAIGVPDDKSGEAVKLVVVRADPALDADSVLDWCRERLTAYKRPRSVVFVDELPKSNVGKILRREVRELHGS